MPFSHGEVKRALTGKLQFRFDPVGRHQWFYREHGGQIVGKCHKSHSPDGRDLNEALISAMARELGITGSQLRKAISCQLSNEGLLKALVNRPSRF